MILFDALFNFFSLFSLSLFSLSFLSLSLSLSLSIYLSISLSVSLSIYISHSFEFSLIVKLFPSIDVESFTVSGGSVLILYILFLHFDLHFLQINFLVAKLLYNNTSMSVCLLTRPFICPLA